MFGKKTSKSVAKERLKLVLINDRVNLSPEIMDAMQRDIINVIKNYIEIDDMGVELNIGTTKSDRTNQQVPALYANIPIKKMKVKKY